MRGRKVITRTVPGFCILLAGFFILAGCETQHDAQNHDWIPITAFNTNSASPGQTVHKHSSLGYYTIKGSSASAPFASYDKAFIETVEHRWFDLLNQQSSIPFNGLVVLEFILNSDGRISDMQVTTTTVGIRAAEFCQKAVLDPAPYHAWPLEMQKTIGHNRRIQFTFYYENKPKSVSEPRF
jgi:hypothetical protein